jgi:hypothetical protein
MTLDTDHQAGKAILKDIEAMYQAHPDWIIKKGIKPVEGEELFDAKPANGKKSKKPKGAAAEDNDDGEADKKRIAEMLESNADVNPLDAVQLDLRSDEIRK